MTIGNRAMNALRRSYSKDWYSKGPRPERPPDLGDFDLLVWASQQSDATLLETLSMGPKSLQWIRQHGGPSVTP